MAAICHHDWRHFYNSPLAIPSRNVRRNAARRAQARLLSKLSNLVLLDLLSSRLWFTPLGSDKGHFLKWLFTKMAVSNMVSDPESEHKAYRKWCVKFRLTPSVWTGFLAVIKHSLSEHLKCLKSKTWNDLTSANFFFVECRMRSAAKRMEQSLGYGYLSKMEWFSLRPQHV